MATKFIRWIRALRGWRRRVMRAALLGGTVVGALLILVSLAVAAEQLFGKSLVLGLLLRTLVTLGAARVGWYCLRLTAIHADEVKSPNAGYEIPAGTVASNVEGETRAKGADSGAAKASHAAREVLYLRSFQDDNIVLGSGGASIVTADSLLGGVLKDAGALVGLARPGDDAPPFGVATRNLDAGADWEPQIEAWIRNASLVVIQAGTTTGLLWELEMARRLCTPERLIVSFLVWQELSRAERDGRYEKFVAVAASALMMPLPTRLERDLFWCFESGWQLTRIEQPRRARLLIGQWALSAEGIREVLRAPMQARGVHLTRWRTLTAALLYPAVLLSGLIGAVQLAIPHLNGQAAREEEEIRAIQERIRRAISDIQNAAQTGGRTSKVAPAGAKTGTSSLELPGQP
jgi:hypothetical protein